MAELIEARTQLGVAGVVPAGHPVLRRHAIARREGQGPELLRVKLRSGEEVLPLFSSGEAAQDFIASAEMGGTWYARECCAGELVSMLLGLYAGVDGVLLDPAHREDAAGGCLPENFMHWGSFVGYLLGDGRESPVRLAARSVAYAATP